MCVCVCRGAFMRMCITGYQREGAREECAFAILSVKRNACVEGLVTHNVFE